MSRTVTIVLLGSAVAGAGLPGAAAAEQTRPPSRIDSDTTWSALESPYLLTGDVRVVEGATLTVEPGVEVQAEPGARLIVAEGAIRVDGGPAAGAEVSFTASEQGEPWGGLTVRARDSGSYAAGAVFGGATTALRLRGELDVTGTRFEGNRTGIAVANPGAALSISGNVFTSNRVAIGGRSRDDVTITGNDFWDNRVNLFARPQRAYDCGPDAALWTITGNDILRGPDTPFYSHDLRTPRGSRTSAYEVDARDNWWGTSNARRVEGRVTDGETGATDGERRRVAWRPPSDAPHTPWTPPGEVDDPPPEPLTVSDQGTLSWIEAPVHATCRKPGSLVFEGRATGVLRKLTSVELSLARRRAQGGCKWWTGRGFRRGRCGDPVWFEVRGLSRWSYELESLPRGRYRVRSRSNAEDVYEPARNDVRFRVRP